MTCDERLFHRKDAKSAKHDSSKKARRVREKRQKDRFCFCPFFPQSSASSSLCALCAFAVRNQSSMTPQKNPPTRRGAAFASCFAGSPQVTPIITTVVVVRTITTPVVTVTEDCQLVPKSHLIASLSLTAAFYISVDTPSRLKSYSLAPVKTPFTHASWI